jgi:outer membrane lipoprotein-sorting protein
MFKSALLVLCVVTPSLAAAQSARDIVVGADHVRNPQRPFRVDATVVEYRSGQPVDKNTFAVYSKVDPATGQFRDVMVYTSPPRDAGKILLLNGSNLWFYDPASRQSVRISPQQKLTGEASAGDVLSENLGVDYGATMVGTDTIDDAARQKRSCWHLELAAAGDAATYKRVEYWVEQGTYNPIKAKFYADSGELLKVLYYRDFVKRGDRVSPAQAVIIDAVNAALVTVVDISELRFQEIPDSWFQRDYLPHLKLE